LGEIFKSNAGFIITKAGAFNVIYRYQPMKSFKGIYQNYEGMVVVHSQPCRAIFSIHHWLITLGTFVYIVNIKCFALGTFHYFELFSICLREGLGRSKPATNP
jgi:hypothetical protein